MVLDRVTIAQVLVSVIAVVLFVIGLVIISSNYGVQNGGETQITPDGGLFLVGLIALFIVIMPVFGFLVERMKPDDEEA